jgi:hypothetical protein
MDTDTSDTNLQRVVELQDIIPHLHAIAQDFEVEVAHMEAAQRRFETQRTPPRAEARATCAVVPPPLTGRQVPPVVR